MQIEVVLSTAEAEYADLLPSTGDILPIKNAAEYSNKANTPLLFSHWPFATWVGTLDCRMFSFWCRNILIQ